MSVEICGGIKKIYPGNHCCCSGCLIDVDGHSLQGQNIPYIVSTVNINFFFLPL